MKEHYYAASAAIRTAYGQRLTTADFRELINLHSVPEIVGYLKETPRYREVLRELEPAITHRTYLETVLRRNVFFQDLHFCSVQQLRRAPFFKFFIYEYEIRELFKAIGTDRENYISAMDTWLDPYLRFSLKDLARAQTPADIIAVVRHTNYEPILRRYLGRERGEPFDYTECEIALRACYLEEIIKEAKSSLKGSDLQALLGLIEEQIDLINLINAFRLKSVFHAERATLRRMMLPVDGKLPRRVCEELYDAPDTDAFMEVLRSTRYGRMMNDIRDVSDFTRMEHALSLLRYRNARNALHFSEHAAVSLYAIHLLNQIELQNVTTVIEGVRYGQSPSYIYNLLILE